MTDRLSSRKSAVQHRWQFRARFRRNAFGWKSRPAIQRVREAVSEIKRVARAQPVLAAEGAVLFLERVSPALEHVDSSSGAIGSAVNNAIAALVPIIVAAPVPAGTREAWLERLWAAHEADAIPYIEVLTDYWGELCASKEFASIWADRLTEITRLALSPDPNVRGHFHGITACFSALYRAERYQEIVDILESTKTIWPYQRWAVRALAAMGGKAEAIRYAESCREPWTSDGSVDATCEEILLSSGLVDEAYQRYALTANRGSTYVATFRAVARKYPHKSSREIITDLARTTPGEEGKWFAAAREAGLFDEALELASRSPCDPKTLARAARDLSLERPAFAVEAGLLALRWLVQGYGYEITGADVWAAYGSTMKAASQQGSVGETRQRIRAIVAGEGIGSSFVEKVLGRELGRT